MLEELHNILKSWRLHTYPVTQILQDCGDFLLEHTRLLQLAVGGAVGSVLLWKLTPRRPGGVPPGPGFALPLLGHLHLVGRDPRAQFTKWRRQYGDIFSLYLGHRLVIVLCGNSVIRDALDNSAHHFLKRPHLLTTEKLTENKGVLFASGPSWRDQRQTALEFLLEVRLGSSQVTEGEVHQDVDELIHKLEGLQGTPTDLGQLVRISVCNTLNAFVTGEHIQRGDPFFDSYFQAVEENCEHAGGISLVNLFPILERLPGDLFGLRRMVANRKVIEEEFLQSHVKMHALKGQRTSPRDFIFAYLDRIDWHKGWKQDSSLCEPLMVRTAADLLLAGAGTTSATLNWALLLLVHHPDVQTRCFQEIRDVVGLEAKPRIRDHGRLVYLEATLREILRFSQVCAFAVPHSNPREVMFRDYVVPKDSVIVPFLGTVLEEESAWDRPLSFLPERFIHASGSLTHPPEFVPFGVGSRRCLGEWLARRILFLYLGALIQRFEFRPPTAQSLPPLDGVFGAVRAPKPYQIRACLRQT